MLIPAMFDHDSTDVRVSSDISSNHKHIFMCLAVPLTGVKMLKPSYEPKH